MKEEKTSAPGCGTRCSVRGGVSRCWEAKTPVAGPDRDNGGVRDLSAIGCLGVLSVATRGDAGTGEVVVTMRGGTESLLAWSAVPLPKGTSVVVIDVVGPRTVQVTAADDVGIGRALP